MYDFKVTWRLSSASDMVQSVANINRSLVWVPTVGEAGIEADVGRVDTIIRVLNLDDAKSTQTPSVKKSAKQMFAAAQSPSPDENDARCCMSLVMPGDYLSQDRPDLSDATPTLAMRMKASTAADMMDFQRSRRHLKFTRAGSPTQAASFT
ncbi:unnamed protein product [Prorocentrum cordatum]|uniref:Uncharacterized protein n=1 Tax=Prorocentrum cordatum TaxID=2364126 RepID=A0ABN9QAH1_9DINO|nr:unnamed protein product [Polarella glacialis]